ncbi:MAG: hypothetical protein ACRC30_03360 [Clostridium sp.]
MVDKNKICIILMALLFLQVFYILKNDSKKDISVDTISKNEIASMYKELYEDSEIKVLEIKNTSRGVVGEIEISGDRNTIIEKINRISKYNIIDYNIDFEKEVLKVNIEIN